MIDLVPRATDELLDVSQNPGSHFLDSGAFTLRTYAIRWGKLNRRPPFDFYDTAEFWKYANDYALFIQTYKESIDLYASLDVIGSPELSYRNLKYLEKEHGLSPLPVVHNKADHKWIVKYMRDYEYIGLGGLAGRKRGDGSREWLDATFNIICATANRHPAVRTHGFGLGEFNILFRYPWYSVDSAGWSSQAAYGSIVVPRLVGGNFTFHKKPGMVVVSDESPELKVSGASHYMSMSTGEKSVVQKWLEFVNVPLGYRNPTTGEVEEQGVTTYHTYRRLSNLLYYYNLQKILPSWERPFTVAKRGFDL